MDTQTIKTPGGHEIVIKTWLSAGDMEPIEEVLLTNGIDDMKELNGPALLKIRRILVTKAVVSVDGQTDNPGELTFALRKKEFDFISTEVMKLLSDEGAEDGKKNDAGQ